MTVPGKHDCLSRGRGDIRRDLPTTVVLEPLGDELSRVRRHRRLVSFRRRSNPAGSGWSRTELTRSSRLPMRGSLHAEHAVPPQTAFMLRVGVLGLVVRHSEHVRVGPAIRHDCHLPRLLHARTTDVGQCKAALVGNNRGRRGAYIRLRDGVNSNNTIRLSISYAACPSSVTRYRCVLLGRLLGCDSRGGAWRGCSRCDWRRCWC